MSVKENKKSPLKGIRKMNAPIIEEWVSDDEEEDVSQPKIKKKTVRPSIVKKEFVKSKQQEKSTRKLLNKLSNIARTPQQNRVAERRNRTLIEAARTMLANSKLPTTFWAEAVNIACYVQNRVLVVKPHNKTPYELFHGRTPTLSFIRPFGCLVTILNTIDHLSKFDVTRIKDSLVGYSLNSKAFRIFNSRTRIVEENLHIKFSESIPNAVGSGPDWLFDINALTRTMNYEPIVRLSQAWERLQSKRVPWDQDLCNEANGTVEVAFYKVHSLMVLQVQKQVIMQVKLERRQSLSRITFCYHYRLLIHTKFLRCKSSHMEWIQTLMIMEKAKKIKKESKCNDQEKEDNVNITNNVNAAGTNEVNVVSGKTSMELPFDQNMPALEDYSIFDLPRI
ncbi:ribonuclease H-like domain-containing protein [Tanacetum coccineum]|uniref:Ribonuclease H-like domain-containing protein n=1 Tax=Tanacetum coccineum TaxID=301880 RepID=A0ABQ5B424_9ASTR